MKANARWLASVVLVAILATLMVGCSSSRPPSAASPSVIADAQRLASQAARFQHQENWASAAAWWQRAARQYQLVNQLTNLAVARHNEGVCQKELGNFDTARSLLEDAARLNMRLNQTDASWRNQIALLQIENEQPPDASTSPIARWEALQAQVKDPRLTAVLAHEVGRAKARVGQPAEALASLLIAESSFALEPNALGLASVAVTRARVLEQLARLADAETGWREALTRFEVLGNPRGVAVALAGLGTCLVKQDKDLPEAEDLLQRAVGNFDALRLPEHANAARATRAKIRATDR